MWFDSYLTDRSQSVHLAEDTTEPRTILCGATQGSVLGPLLFTMYTADIGLIIKAHGLLHHCYADDTQLYLYCHPAECSSLKSRVLLCIDFISNWMASNRLKLNPSKSEFLWCATARRLHLVDKSVFSLEEGDVTPSTSVRNLGAFFDASMDICQPMSIDSSARASTNCVAFVPSGDQHPHRPPSK